MFESDPIHERGKALEDEFFHRVDEKLRQKLQESMQRDAAREKLRVATGFKDEALLDHLLDGGFEASRIAALALVPAVFVAWADGSVTPQERQAVLSAALHHGVNRELSAFKLIESWLEQPPPRKLWNLWKEYVIELRATMTPMLSITIANEIQHQARVVAEASRKPLEFKKISKEEQQVLDDLDNVLR